MAPRKKKPVPPPEIAESKRLEKSDQELDAIINISRKKKIPIEESSEHRREDPASLREEQLKAVIQQAMDGDTSAAKEILENFCDSVKEGESRGGLHIHPMEISPSILKHLSDCFQNLLDEIIDGKPPEANKALRLTAPSRGRKREHDDVAREWKIWFNVRHKIAEKNLPIKTAIIETAEEIEKEEKRKLGWRTAEAIYNKINRQIGQAK